MSGCEEVQENLVAVARGEKVSAPAERHLRQHVENCPQCRRRLANERMLSAGLASVASASAAVPPAEVRAALMAEFRRRRVVVPIRRRAMTWITIAAVAAAVLLAILIPKGHRAEAVVATVKTPVVVAPVPRVAPVAVAARKPSGQAKAHPTRRRRPPAEETPEVATDFFEIPYAEPLRPEERADVFRIQVPRASMAAFGLPVTGGRLDSRIKADVLTGEDGVVRAVRFIR